MTERPSLPAVIVFDWDNTLVDTWSVVHESLNVTLRAMGHDPWPYEETRRRVRRSLRESFPDLFGIRWEEARRIFYAAFERIHIERLQPIAGAEALLASLSAAGIHLAVLSNKTGAYLRTEVAHLGWSGYFVGVVGAGDAARDKPAPESLHMALAGIPLSPGPDVWIVGDAGIDMELAHATGCLPVLLHADGEHTEFARWPPAHCFESCGRLLEFIKG